MDAEDLDQQFDDGEDITPYLDPTKTRRPNREPRRVNVDFPTWMVDAPDREAGRLEKVGGGPQRPPRGQPPLPLIGQLRLRATPQLGARSTDPSITTIRVQHDVLRGSA